MAFEALSQTRVANPPKRRLVPQSLRGYDFAGTGKTVEEVKAAQGYAYYDTDGDGDIDDVDVDAEVEAQAEGPPTEAEADDAEAMSVRERIERGEDIEAESPEDGEPEEASVDTKPPRKKKASRRK